VRPAEGTFDTHFLAGSQERSTETSRHTPRSLTAFCFGMDQTDASRPWPAMQMQQMLKTLVHQSRALEHSGSQDVGGE
jgi:hypothetical protein